MTSAFLVEVLRSAVAWAICCAAGIGVLAVAPARFHRTLLPAVPVLGVAAVVVAGHWITFVVPYRIGAAVIALLAVGGASEVLVRPSWRLSVDRRAVVVAAIVTAAALPGVAILTGSVASSPSTGITFTTGNHDQFYFAAVTDWFVEHRNTEVPDIGSSNRSADGPADGPTEQYQPFARWGEASFQGLPTALLGGRTTDHWFVLSASTLLLLPGAAALLARGLGSRSRAATIAGAAVGLVVCGGGVLAQLVLNQNGAFVLGLPLLVSAVGVGTLAIVTPFDRRLALVAAVAWAGWLGTYYELAVVAAPLAVAAIVLTRRRSWPATLRSTAVVGGLTVVVGVLPVVQAVTGMLFLGGASPTWASYFAGNGTWAVLGKLVGQRGLGDLPIQAPRAAVPATLVLLAAWLVALVAALCWRPTRWLLPVVSGVCLAAWWVQSRGATNYTANRIVAIGLVVVGVLGLIGATAVIEPVLRRVGTTVRVSFGAVGLVVVAVALATTLQQVVATVDWSTHERSVTAADREAERWVRELGGAGGSGVVVATTDYARQLILLDLTRDLSDVGWSVLAPDYTGVWGFSSAERPRYVLTDRTARIVGHLPEAHSNDRWVMYELVGSGAVVTSPTGFRVTPGPDGAEHWIGAGGTSAIVASADCPSFDLALTSGGPPVQQVEVRVGEAVRPTSSATRVAVSTAGPTEVEVAAPGDGTIGLRVGGVDGAEVDLVSELPSACRSDGAAG